MKKSFPDRIEIFLALALRQSGRLIANDDFSDTESEANFAARKNEESNETRTTFSAFTETVPALFNRLKQAETERLERLWIDYQKKTETEKVEWQAQIFGRIGADEQFIDERIHQSHIAAALEKEPATIQRIVRRFLDQNFNAPNRTNAAKSDSGDAPISKNALSLEKTVRRAFAEQFVSLRDLKKITAFDQLSGAQTARLIRLTGIREVATACVRIEAVEAVAAFLRIFSAEDAQAIAAQLNGLPKISVPRLEFAEETVQATLENEPQPTAMLDALGFRLLGIALCRENDSRVRFATQKLPLEIAPKLLEIIEKQCREIDGDLRKQIAAEIERLAENLLRAKTATK